MPVSSEIDLSRLSAAEVFVLYGVQVDELARTLESLAEAENALHANSGRNRTNGISSISNC